MSVFICSIFKIENTFLVNMVTVVITIILCCGSSEVTLGLWNILRVGNIYNYVKNTGRGDQQGQTADTGRKNGQCRH